MKSYTISIDPTFGSTLLDQITSVLEEDHTTASFDTSSDIQCIVIHVYPGDFSNISNGMRSIITGFVEKSGMEEHGETSILNRHPSN